MADYITGTPDKVSAEFKEWIDQSLSLLEDGDKVFEIGSSFGRDAAYIEALGYTVQHSDAVGAFVDLLAEQGRDAVVFNALSDEWPRGYDMFFANAVLLHFTEEDFEKVLFHAYEALGTGGVFAFSLKTGEGEEWSSHKMGEPRYFKYWQVEPVNSRLRKVGFKKISLQETADQKWLHAIAEK